MFEQADFVEVATIMTAWWGQQRVRAQEVWGTSHGKVAS